MSEDKKTKQNDNQHKTSQPKRKQTPITGFAMDEALEKSDKQVRN